MVLRGVVLSRVILLRHGRTSWHAEGRYAGKTDIPLDEVGREQSRKVAQRLGGESVELLYSSPLSRCFELAELIGREKGLKPVVDERLGEVDLGLWDGLDYRAIVERDAEILMRWTTDPTSVTVPGGESLTDVQKRSLEWLKDAAAHSGDGTIVASTHGGLIRTIIAAVLGLPLSNVFRLTIDLASISIINYLGEFSNIEVINDTSHLKC